MAFKSQSLTCNLSENNYVIAFDPNYCRKALVHSHRRLRIDIVMTQSMITIYNFLIQINSNYLFMCA